MQGEAGMGGDLYRTCTSSVRRADERAIGAARSSPTGARARWGDAVAGSARRNGARGAADAGPDARAEGGGRKP